MPKNILKYIKELFNKSSKDKNLENVNKTSVDIVHRWAKQMIKNHKKEDYYDNEPFKDSLLLIEWEDIGLLVRRLKNLQHNKTTLVNLIRSQSGYSPFLPQGLPSDCAFLFADRQSLSNALSVLFSNKWSRHEDNTIDVGRVFEVQVSKKGDFDITEHLFVFNLKILL